MATGTIHLYSAALAGETTYTILLPDPAKVGPGPYSVLLQLHGRSDDHRAWLEKTRLWSYVEWLPLIVVMPSGGNFWWSNLAGASELGLHYEDFLAHELWEHIQSMFSTRTGARWAIGGLSMGGFGAIRLGLKYPDRYSSIYAHSSALFTRQELAERLPILPPAVLADMDCYGWAAQSTSTDIPRLGFDCGKDDFLLEHNRRFHTHLEGLGLPHTYREYPGAHTWDYWDAHVPEALEQHCEVLGITPVPPPGGTA